MDVSPFSVHVSFGKRLSCWIVGLRVARVADQSDRMESGSTTTSKTSFPKALQKKTAKMDSSVIS